MRTKKGKKTDIMLSFSQSAIRTLKAEAEREGFGTTSFVLTMALARRQEFLRQVSLGDTVQRMRENCANVIYDVHHLYQTGIWQPMSLYPLSEVEKDESRENPVEKDKTGYENVVFTFTPAAIKILDSLEQHEGVDDAGMFKRAFLFSFSFSQNFTEGDVLRIIGKSSRIRTIPAEDWIYLPMYEFNRG